MAFGLLTTRWQLLKQPLGVSLIVATKALECISQLHNICIDMRSPDLTSEQEIEEIIPIEASPLGWGYLPTVEPLAFPIQCMDHHRFLMLPSSEYQKSLISKVISFSSPLFLDIDSYILLYHIFLLVFFYFKLFIIKYLSS